MLDLINALACGVMLFLTFPIAVTMNSSGHHFQRLLFSLVVVVLSLQVMAPVYEFLPAATWLQAGFNLMLLCATVAGRRHIMTLVRLTVGKRTEPKDHPCRRAEDLDTEQLARVHGRGKY